MPTYEFPLEDFNRMLGNKPTTFKELEENLPYMAVPVDKGTEDQVAVEVFANRPDMLGVEGLARMYAGFTEREIGIPTYLVEETEPFHVYIKNEMKKYRPYLFMAKITGLKLNDMTVQAFFTLQEKLHTTHARNRKKASIGFYDIHSGRGIKPPITFKMIDKDAIKFIPLDETEMMSPREMLEKTQKGRDYAHLVPENQTPLLIDSKDIILSIPPILNAEECAVTEDTTEIFVDVTGWDWLTCIQAFNMILTALADRGGKIHSAIHHYEYDTPGGREIKLPDFSPAIMELDPKYVSKKLGMDLTIEDQIFYLKKNRLGAKITKNKKN